MIILVSGATTTVKKNINHPNLGQLITPHDGNKIICEKWAADNAAYSNWDRRTWLRMLNKIEGTEPLFVVAPDVVCDAIATDKRLKVTYPMIKKRGLKVALALQNGQEWIGVPWYCVDAIFIGGDDKFKLSQWVRYIVQSAKEKGKWVHMGRVNSFKRLQYAMDIGCDSVDGSGFSMFAEKKLKPALDFLSKPQLPLFKLSGQV